MFISVAYFQVHVVFSFERVATKILEDPCFTLGFCDCWGEGGKSPGGWTGLVTIWGQRTKGTACGMGIEAGVHKRSCHVTGRFRTSGS